MPIKKPVIILVHGIRDHALWQQEIRDALEKDGDFIVEATNYGRFDLLRFLLPISYFRRKAIAEILKQFKTVILNNPGADISVIAHSFGTYIVGHILKENFDLKFNRIILCGSILRYDFPFEQFQSRFTPKILNEVGTRDIWPAMAESVTWGYGSAGTFGFKRPLVYDRWHNKAAHGYFLSASFCRKFWIPFLRDGTIVPDSARPEKPHTLVQLINILRLKYLVPVFAALSVAATPYVEIPDPCPGLPGDIAWIDAGELTQGKFATRSAFVVEGRSAPPETVRRGDWIKLTESRRTMIVDYQKTGTQRAQDSPLSPGGDIDYTCKVLKAGDQFYVAFVDAGNSRSIANRMWLKIRATAPGS
ncbi:hypothetical protein SAMN05518861_1602 [Mesorhizobium sp. YR577]|nr:hypothetical protein SAMN05518861_1602 [Mesorhizobium sp. YR577]